MMKKRDQKNQSKIVNNSEKVVARARGLFVVALLDRFCDLIYNAIVKGLWGYIFSCYSSEQAALENGFVAKCTFKSATVGRVCRKTREVLSKGYEESFFLIKIRSLVKKLLATPIKSYGKSLLSFGIYTILIYFILSYECRKIN